MKKKIDYFMEVDLSGQPKDVVRRKYGDHPLEAFEQKFADLFIKGLFGWELYLMPESRSKDFRKRWKSLKGYKNQLRTKICYNCSRVDVEKKSCMIKKTQCRVNAFHRNICKLITYVNDENCENCYEGMDSDELNNIPIARKIIKRMKSWRRNRYKWKQKAFACKRALDSALEIDIEWAEL